MHWLLVRLLRSLPGTLPEAEIRAALDENLTGQNLAVEAATFRDGPRPVRPYGWAGRSRSRTSWTSGTTPTPGAGLLI